MNFSHFLAGWLPALAVSSVVPQTDLGELGLVSLGGLPIPVITCVLGLLGIVMARPLARKSEAELGWPAFLLVSVIMLVLVELWIVESRPGWLFAFVVAIGLGFSGYSLLELLGDQIRDFARSILERAKSTIGRRPPDGDSK